MDGSFSSVFRSFSLVEVDEEWMKETLPEGDLSLKSDPLDDKEGQIPSLLTILENEREDRRWTDLGLFQFENSGEH